MSSIAAAADFTSALFLGQRHPSGEIRQWNALTTGVPAALRESPESRRLAMTVAGAQHAASGLVARSALHGLVDVLETLPQPGDRILVDEGAYPLALWVCRLAESRGVRVSTFPHHQPPSGPLRGRLWIVTDGWCQGCCRPAPLARMRDLARRAGGLVIVDDSLAFGVLGRKAGNSFGDGTGTVCWSGLKHDGFLWLASLAKAYGAPITVITGDEATIETVARNGSNRLYSSPPSAADLGAGLDALAAGGETRFMRDRLCRKTRWLRHAFTELGLTPQGRCFPVVGTCVGSRAQARRWQDRLAEHRVHALVQLPRCHAKPVLSAVVRADHTQGDLDRLVRALAEVSGNRRAA